MKPPGLMPYENLVGLYLERLYLTSVEIVLWERSLVDNHRCHKQTLDMVNTSLPEWRSAMSN